MHTFFFGAIEIRKLLKWFRIDLNLLLQFCQSDGSLLWLLPLKVIGGIPSIHCTYTNVSRISVYGFSNILYGVCWLLWWLIWMHWVWTLSIFDCFHPFACHKTNEFRLRLRAIFRLGHCWLHCAFAILSIRKYYGGQSENNNVDWKQIKK